MNKKLLVKAPLVLVPALISAIMLSSCADTSAIAETLARGEESATVLSTTVVDTTVVTTTETTSQATSSETTLESTESVTMTSSTTETTESTMAESSSSRKSITDLFTTIDLRNPREPKTNADGSVDFSCFDNCAFVGNSRLLAVESYGFCDNVYAKVGLNVNTVFTECCSGSSKTVINELNGKHYSKVFLMFGDNECGWGSMSAFKNQYAKVIKAVKERIPTAKIYLISVLPISKATSAKNEFGCNKDSINNVNKIIKQLAGEQGVTYMNAAVSITDAAGYLPDEASPDGCHLGKKYTKIWLEYVARNMK